MSRSTRVIVTCYACRKKLSPDSDWTYQVWIVPEVCPEGDADAGLEAISDLAVSAKAAEQLRERLREAVAESVASRVEGMVWKTADDLSEKQVTSLIAGLPDTVKTLVQQPLDRVAGAAGVPGPAAVFGSDVAANCLLKPVLEPMEKAVHGLEVAGIVICLAMGLHPLAIICAKYLVHDEAQNALASAITQLPEAFTTAVASNKDAVNIRLEDSKTPAVDRALALEAVLGPLTSVTGREATGSCSGLAAPRPAVGESKAINPLNTCQALSQGSA